MKSKEGLSTKPKRTGKNAEKPYPGKHSQLTAKPEGGETTRKGGEETTQCEEQ